jgi:hypothetical protein
MNKTDCENTRFSSRTIGLLVLALAVALAFIGGLIVPVAGLLFAVPLFILAFTFLWAPESKVCRLLLRRDA